MSISGHKTDSMERRYNIVDGEDMKTAKELLEQRKKMVPAPARQTAASQFF
jgi:hypothetical protein